MSSRDVNTPGAVVGRWNSTRGLPATDASALSRLPQLLREIYALADGGYDTDGFGFHSLADHRCEQLQLPGEEGTRSVLIFADFMMAHEFGLDDVSGGVVTSCMTPFVVATSIDAFFELYLSEDSSLWVEKL